MCRICRIDIVTKHDFNLIKGKTDYEGIIESFYELIKIERLVRPKPFDYKYICKQCLTLLKRWQGLKTSLKSSEETLKSRIKWDVPFTEGAVKSSVT